MCMKYWYIVNVIWKCIFYILLWLWGNQITLVTYKLINQLFLFVCVKCSCVCIHMCRCVQKLKEDAGCLSPLCTCRGQRCTFCDALYCVLPYSLETGCLSETWTLDFSARLVANKPQWSHPHLSHSAEAEGVHGHAWLFTWMLGT